MMFKKKEKEKSQWADIGYPIPTKHQKNLKIYLDDGNTIEEIRSWTENFGTFEGIDRKIAIENIAKNGYWNGDIFYPPHRISHILYEDIENDK